MTLHEYDIEKIKEKSITYLAGVDEAGRGPLAGPVCAAAVVLPKDFYVSEINDSKKLTEKKREKLYDVIIENAISYSIAFADVDYIEKNNIHYNNNTLRHIYEWAKLNGYNKTWKKRSYCKSKVSVLE